jgi:8-oxo-dGTP pyrophosphatase MutT (NUDIX family)
MLHRLAQTLAERPGVLAADDGAPARAAVALALRIGPEGEPEILLIRRATREGDPWSGQVALPGGRWSPNDASLQETAYRETAEETGLALAVGGLLLGTLDELRPRTPALPPIIVTPFVVVTPGDAALVPNHEVAAAFWMPVRHLRDPDVARESVVQVRGATWRVPSFVFGEYVVWGMTERILRQLLELMA